MAPLAETEHVNIWDINSLRQYELLVEYTNLKDLNQCPDGMYLIPQPNRLGEFEGVLYVRDELFNGMVIRFDLFYDDYPRTVPLIKVETRIPHPLVDNGQCLHIGPILAKDQLITLSSVLKAISTAFSDKLVRNIQPEQCINLPSVKDMAASDAPLKGQSADQAIYTNLVFCITFGSILFLSFCILRRIFRELYAANVLNTRRVPDGLFRWVTSVLSINDDELLPWVGLDGFIYLQTIKLMIGILVVLAIPALCILIPIYYVGSATSSEPQLFLQTSAMSLNKQQLLWVTLMFNYFMAIVVFYGLYMFYRNLSTYRQVFLHNPGSCVAQVSMRRLAKTIGNMESARKLINISGRSIIVTNVSSKYSKRDLIEVFASMGLEDISAIVIVQNRSKVRKMLERRNASVMTFESDIRRFYIKLLDFVATTKGLSTAEVEKQYKNSQRIHAIERQTLMRQLIHDPNLFSEIRQKRVEEGMERDILNKHYNELIQHDDELLEIANRFAADNERYSLENSNTGSSLIAGHESSNDSSDDLLVSGKAVVSWAQFLDVKQNVKDYGLTLWGTSMSIIVVFGSQRSAAISQQALLSYRPFSMEAQPAPTADDIIWDNLYFPEGDRFIRSLAVDILYVMVNILFTFADLIIAPLLSIDLFESEIPILGRFIARYPRLRGVLKGVLAPLFYNLFLLLAPYMLYGLAIFQGTISKTKVQENLLQRYTWFLFIQSFVMFLFSSAFVVVKVVTGRYGEVIARIQAYLPDYAAFFTNLILQRASISLMTALINPGALTLLFFNAIFFKNNIRKKVRSTEPNRILIGALYPEYLVMVFIITLAFIPLTPIISLAGLIFYCIAYLVFRYHFIFTFEIPHESGGRYWMFLPTPLMVGCLTAQIFSVIQFSFSEGVIQALSMVPLIIITIGGIIFIRRVFSRRATHLPLSQETSHRTLQLSERMQAKQTETVRAVALEAGEDTSFLGENIESISSNTRDQSLLGLRNYETVPYDFGEQEGRLFTNVQDGTFGDMTAQENPYYNPIMFKRYPLIFLPPCFFHVLQDAMAIINRKKSA